MRREPLPRLVRHAVSIAALTLLVPRFASAQQRDRVISGVVVIDSTGRALPGATVTILDAGIAVVTNLHGEFRLLPVAPGMHVIEIRHAGYSRLRDSVVLKTGEPLDLEIRLVRAQVTTLDTVRTVATERPTMSPGLAGFEERRRAGQGWFVSDSALRQHELQTLSDLLPATIPGLRVLRQGMTSVVASGRDNRSGKSQVLSRPGSVIQGCYSTIYLDGVLLYDIDADPNEKILPPDINSFSISELAGIEYHGPATTPVQFKRSVCGTLLLWTRD